MVYITIIDPGTDALGGVMAVPDQQFQDIIEQIEETIKKTLANLSLSPAVSTFDPDAFRQELLRDIREIIEENADPFDPTVFRNEILRDIQQLFDEFRQQLTLSLEGAQTLPPFAHVSEDDEASKKQSWLDKPIGGSWLNKPLFKKEK